MNKKALSTIQDESLKRDLIQAEDVMNKLGIPHGYIREVSVSNRMTSCLGKAIGYKFRKDEKGRMIKLPKTEYELRFSHRILHPDYPHDMRMSTIYHELIHTIPGCMNHGPLWKSYGERVSQATGLTIERLAKGSDIPEHLRAKRKTRDYKYLIKCKDCSFSQPRKQWSKVLENLQDYRCPRCGGDLEAYRITGK